MPEQEDSALSQQAIDALLAGGAPAEEDEIEEAEEPAERDEDDSEDVAEGDKGVERTESAEEPSTGDSPELGPSVSQNDVQEIARDVVGSATESLSNDLDALKTRISEIESALTTIEKLEKQVAGLRDSLVGKKALDSIDRRLAAIESGAKNTPVFNLYEKMTCGSCGTHGAGQVRARCSGCGKEGWFGRKAPVEQPQSVVQRGQEKRAA